MSPGCCCEGSGPNPARATAALTEAAETFYDRVGGNEWFVGLVERFYDGVKIDPVLRPMYPTDLTGPRKRLAMFLAQYFGGSPDYNATRGYPRLRMRHFRFPIGAVERDAWFALMTKAVRAGGLAPSDEDEMLEYFASTATMLMNSGGGVSMCAAAVGRPSESEQ
jgi:hemoglobin